MKQIIVVFLVSGLLIGSLLIIGNKNRSKMETDTMNQKTRAAFVAGTFYPENKKALEKQIADFLKQGEKKVNSPQILIVPHAGYDYSGKIAAAGFKQIDKNIKRVVLIGASHQSWFNKAAIDNNDFWETPLGSVPLDKDWADKIVDNEKIVYSYQEHTQEHSLEVEIPFLQTVLSEFSIVPILLGQVDDATLEKLTQAITQNLDEDTLIVISTDLSHYPTYDVAQDVDKKTIESILTGDSNLFMKTINEQLSVDYPNLDTCACGYQAVKTGIIISQKINNGQWQLVDYANSGDVPGGDQGRVVGYAAITWNPNNNNKVTESNPYTQEEKDLLLKIARETLESYLKDKTIPEFKVNNTRLEEKLGVFVTLNKNHQLRGCIGEFESTTPLWQTVSKKAVDAAVNDPRFPSVKLEELKDIKIEISILSKPKRINSWQDIELGKHGVIIKQGNKGGTFLPQVATETNWSKEEFLSQLCSQKAGLKKDCYKDPKTEIYTYTAEVFSES